MDFYAGQKIALLTQHGKESVIAPVLEPHLGCTVTLVSGYDTDQLGQGRENARNYLLANPDLANELEKKIKERMNIGPRVDVPAGVDPVTGEVEF